VPLTASATGHRFFRAESWVAPPGPDKKLKNSLGAGINDKRTPGHVFEYRDLFCILRRPEIVLQLSKRACFPPSQSPMSFPQRIDVRNKQSF